MKDTEHQMSEGVHTLLAERAANLENSLDAALLASLSPENNKTLRQFTAGEAARFLGVTTSYLRTAHGRESIPDAPDVRGGHRFYTAQSIDAIRHALEQQAKSQGSYVKGRRDGDKLAVIAVATFKGGSGKTSTSIHVAQSLALRGYRVLALDLDPQASLTSFFGFIPEIDLEGIPTLYDAIRYDSPLALGECVRTTYFHNLSMIPANLELHTFEHETPVHLMQQNSLPEDERSPVPFYQRLATALTDVEDDFDVVIIDCPPALGFLTLAGLCASTGMLVTVVPNMLDVVSLSSFLKMSGELLGVVENNGLSMKWDFQKFLLSRFEPSDGPQTQMSAYLRNQFREDVLTNALLKSTAIGDAGLTRQTLFEIERGAMNRQTYDRAMESILGVSSEIEQLIQKGWGR